MKFEKISNDDILLKMKSSTFHFFGPLAKSETPVPTRHCKESTGGRNDRDGEGVPEGGQQAEQTGSALQPTHRGGSTSEK